MEHFKLVLPEHMNHQGYLFGGNLLKWIDEFAYITANTQFPGHQLVTIALENVVFRHRIECGQILCFSVNLKKKGTTSLNYDVSVYGARGHSQGKGVLFETSITFVNLDEKGNKLPLPQED
ncbi:acyl-CoA thioesterase [Pleionea sp. CnH1-48]|uniref:acyl-CoA thioesterase n=1 Tax=Pleionea sp. CnH1-48 TaxID=2954494 RepID=UPI00209724FE|nr:acyl-CoA thioesterase [Pleionea sp. CnH1-48]MCO7225124.1 acyl-CoA thioesterase [Pleionea sp. CnH1-48]